LLAETRPRGGYCGNESRGVGDRGVERDCKDEILTIDAEKTLETLHGDEDEERHEHHDGGGEVEPSPSCHSDYGRLPYARSGSETLDAPLALDYGTRTNEAYAGENLRSDTSGIAIEHIGIGLRNPYRYDDGARRAKTYKRESTQPGIMSADLAFEADAETEDETEGEANRASGGRYVVFGQDLREEVEHGRSVFIIGRRYLLWCLDRQLCLWR